jgi:hypothetical protein
MSEEVSYVNYRRVRVGRIRAIKVRVGVIRGFIYGSKSEVKDFKR